LATEKLDWLTPFEKATGQKPDISALLAFRWWEPVYYAAEATYPNTKERLGRMVGIAEHQGDAMTWLILDNETTQVLCRSAVRSALDPHNPNLRAESPDTNGNLSSEVGEISSPIQSVSDLTGMTDTSKLRLPKFSPEELIGLNFTREMDDGKTYYATVVQKILDNDAANHEKIKMLIRVGDGTLDELISYNELSHIIEQQQDQKEKGTKNVWAFTGIKSHHGPLTKQHRDYKGSSYNVVVEWEDGSETTEPLDIMIKDDPVTVAEYAAANNLTDKPGWKRLKHIIRNRKRLERMAHAANVARKGTTYQFGVEVPRNVKHAYELDKKNGNTLWADAIAKELGNIQQYETFKDMGNISYMPGYKKIVVHLSLP
jgi:hypothetical protein